MGCAGSVAYGTFDVYLGTKFDGNISDDPDGAFGIKGQLCAVDDIDIFDDDVAATGDGSVGGDVVAHVDEGCTQTI